MESHSCLGIYIGKKTATAVCVNPHGKVLGCFSVSVEDQEDATIQTLASLLAQGCAERKLKFSDVAVALDCAMFMQHSVHSNFTDPKRIAATIKFDTEEALATDITDVALAFEIVSSDETGSNLTVFTARRDILSQVLDALQQYNLDPITIEPDVGCLSRFVHSKAVAAEPQEGGTLFAVLSRRSGYLIAPPATADAGSQPGAVRTFLIGKTQNRDKLLAREVLVTTAIAERTEPIVCLKVSDSAGGVNHSWLSEKTGFQCNAIDLGQAAGVAAEMLADCAGAEDFAIAHGAALSHRQKGHIVNFRDDFSPFQGKKVRMQRSLKFAAASVTVLLVAVGVFLHTQLYAASGDSRDLRTRFAKDYSDVTLSRLSDGTKIRDAVRKLGDLKRRIEREKKGLSSDETAVSAKLTLLLTAINKCATKTGLNIDSLNVAPKTITVTGDASSRQTGQTLFQTLRDSGLEIVKENVVTVNGREEFNIMVEPKVK